MADSVERRADAVQLTAACFTSSGCHSHHDARTGTSTIDTTIVACPGACPDFTTRTLPQRGQKDDPALHVTKLLTSCSDI
jgi:urease accessory protein UreH